MVMTASVLERETENRPALQREFLDQAFFRATGRRRVLGNSIRVLQDAEANYAAWHHAIASAKKTIYFENYLFEEGFAASSFSEALLKKAREGVSVRIVYDWMGCRGLPFDHWRALEEEGVQIRCFNPPSLRKPLAWIHRDHRKTLCVDGRIGFVGGLCVSDQWLGDASKGLSPWRDTGVEMEGPVVIELQRVFADFWSSLGDSIPVWELAFPDEDLPGGMAARLVATRPSRAELYRLDQLIASAAREKLWLTDSYFLGTSIYLQSLRAAALDGVDVRLLVSSITDIPIVKPFSRGDYLSLLRAGVRVYEWNGSVLHAKTAVADGRWARVGSTNLNPASWISNHELDVFVEDASFAREMEEMFLKDLEHSSEIVLSSHAWGKGSASSPKPLRERAAAKAHALRSAASAHLSSMEYRLLGSSHQNMRIGAGLGLIVFSAAVWVWPRIVSLPLVAVSLCFAWLLLGKASRQFLRARRKKGFSRKPVDTPREF